MIISKKIILAFEDNVFVFKLQSLFYQKSEFLFKMFIKRTLYLTKSSITGRQKHEVNPPQMKMKWLNMIYIIQGKFFLAKL